MLKYTANTAAATVHRIREVRPSAAGALEQRGHQSCADRPQHDRRDIGEVRQRPQIAFGDVAEGGGGVVNGRVTVQGGGQDVEDDADLEAGGGGAGD